MTHSEEITPQQAILDEMGQEKLSAEDRQALDELQAGFEEERRQALAEIGERSVSKLVVLGDGTVAHKDELGDDRDAGTPYSKARRY